MKKKWELHLSCLVHNILKSDLPSYLREKLVFRNTLHSSQLRYVGTTLHIPQHKTELYKSSFSYMSALSYNKLPDDMKKLSAYTFKSKMKSMLLND